MLLLFSQPTDIFSTVYKYPQILVPCATLYITAIKFRHQKNVGEAGDARNVYISCHSLFKQFINLRPLTKDSEIKVLVFQYYCTLDLNYARVIRKCRVRHLINLRGIKGKVYMFRVHDAPLKKPLIQRISQAPPAKNIPMSLSGGGQRQPPFALALSRLPSYQHLKKVLLTSPPLRFLDQAPFVVLGNATIRANFSCKTGCLHLSMVTHDSRPKCYALEIRFASV